MTLLRHTTFQGLPIFEADVAAPVTAAHQRTIAGDQALNYELLTNSAADNSLSPATAGHDHSEAGNRLYWPVLYHSFGDHQSRRHYMRWTAYDTETRSRNLPATIREDLFAPLFPDPLVVQDLTTFIFPFFVPPAFAGRPYELAFRSDSNPLYFRARLEMPLSTVVDEKPLQREQRDNVYSCTLTPQASGVHVVRVLTGVATANFAHEIYEMALRPLPDYPGGSADLQFGRPSPQPGYSVRIGDEGYAWHPVDSLLAADMMPVGTVQLINAGNDTFLQERAYGFPATGNETLHVAAHDHSGAAGFGAEVAASLGAWSFGAYPVGSSRVAPDSYAPEYDVLLDGSTTPYNVFFGNGLSPPCVRNTTQRVCFSSVIRTPASVNFAEANSKLRFAALAYSHGALKQNNGNLVVHISTLAGATITTRTLTSTTTSDDYELLTTTDGWSFNSGGYTTVVVTIASTTTNDAGVNVYPAGLCGLCAYTDP